MNRDGRSCATCNKAHLAGHHLAGVTLECRALPPVRDVGRYARYPEVHPDDYCHDRFEPDHELIAQEEKS